MKSKSSGSCTLSRHDALKILKDYDCSPRLLRHSLAVSKNAKYIAERIKSNGIEIDVDFVEIAALLHDVGRCKVHGPSHGIEGAAIMQEISPGIARVCERHIGAGLVASEASSLGLPAKDYLPETLEEKVIAHADNLVQEDRVVSIDDAVKDFEKKLGKGHSAVLRVRELNDYIENLCDNAKT